MEQGSNCWHELLLQRCNKGAIWSVTPCCKGAVDRRGVTWDMIYCCKGALQAPGSNLKHRVLLRGIQSKLFRVVFCWFFLQFKASSYFARYYRAAVDVLDRVAPVLKAPTSGHRDFKLKVGKRIKKYFFRSRSTEGPLQDGPPTFWGWCSKGPDAVDRYSFQEIAYFQI